tara:strand:+ start:239 stop:601 length:363 start_codon:yes stop_codon:yes gene_type:complete
MDNLNNRGRFTYLTADTIIIAIALFVVVIVIIYIYNQYQAAKKKKDKETSDKRAPAQCPDYWDAVGENVCRNTHKIGKCGHTNTVSFNDPMFSNPKTSSYMKCKYSKECNTPWNGISDLC